MLDADFSAPGIRRRSALSQIVAQQAAIAEIGQRALGERRLDVLFSDTCAMVARILGTELVSVLELSPDARALKVVAGVGWRPGVVGEWSVPAATGSLSGFTLATGDAVIVEDLARERRFGVAPVLAEHGAVSGISVRIGEPSQPFGTISAFTGRRGRFTRDDARFLEAVGGVLASAIARVHADDELRRSRDELSAILSGVTEGITVQAADGRLLFANDAAARLSGFETGAEMAAARPGEILEHFELLDEDGRATSAERLPGRVALATGRRARALVRFRVRSTGEERWSHVQASPIVSADGGVSRVVSVFRDVTAEKTAEQAQALIADTLGTLGATLDPDEAARRLAAVCVPRLADYAEVDIIEPDGALVLAAAVHSDPHRLELIRSFRLSRADALGEEGGAAWVVRERRPALVQITAESLRAARANEDEIDTLSALNLRSYLCVPLIARGSAIGALTLVTAESDRTLGERDVRLAQELAARAAVALENAQLFHAANERRAELDAVLASMAEAVLVFDARGRLRLSNRAARGLFGDVPATIDALRARLVDEISGVPPASDAIEGEYLLAASEKWLEIRLYATIEGTAAGTAGRSSLVVVARDVTASRFAQVTREAFLGVMSHELRTPITTIYGGSELLAHGLDEERQGEVIRDIRAESGRLVRLVEDLLVMTRVERGVLEIGDEPLLLQRVLPSVVASLAPSWPGLQVALDLDDRLPAVRGDVTYIEQVVRNLIVNAIRYGDALNSGVEVTAQASANEVLVRVLDHGPGLRGADPDELFELFYRAPAARAVSGGAGIGLFVCRALLEAMGGRIWAREREGGGAEFGFALATIEAD